MKIRDAIESKVTKIAGLKTTPEILEREKKRFVDFLVACHKDGTPIKYCYSGSFHEYRDS